MVPAKNFQRLTNRLTQKAIRESNDLLSWIGLERLLFNHRDGRAILCYHGVDSCGDKSLNMRHISQRSLERHFQILSRHFHVINVSDFFHGRFKEGRFNVAITFDDGYRNNYKYLLPLVEKYGIPVSIYVTGINRTPHKFLWADFADIVSKYSNRDSVEFGGHAFLRKDGVYITESGQKLNSVIKEHGGWSLKEQLIAAFPEFHSIASAEHLVDYWQLMTDDEIRDMDLNPFVTIGSHGYHHDNLGNIPISDARRDLTISKDYLEEVLQREVNELAFPDGSYTREVLDVADSMGLHYQLALDYLHAQDRTDPRVLDRHGIYPVYSEVNQIMGFLNTGNETYLQES